MPRTAYVDYEPRGAAREILLRKEAEVGMDGPAGTGKTRGCLEKVHLCAEKYRGMRALMVRKVRSSLTNTGQVTYEEKVLPSKQAVKWVTTDQEYVYPNRSTLGVAGMDKASKVMSSQYDMIFASEATELTENDYQILTTRLRNHVMPYQQLLFDCNPRGPKHWLKQRADAGRAVMLHSRYEDNPELWDAKAGTWTAPGKQYIDKLDALTGVRYLWLRKGLWAAAEGIVYEDWDPAIHLVDAFPVPAEWPRYWVVDFGFTNPFVWQAWAEDLDGRLYRYREIYRTKRLVEDHARQILEVCAGEPFPRAIICDHDAEDRATLERHLGMVTTPAHKSVRDGIQAVAQRLRKAGDGKPRLMFMRDALVERDPELADVKQPTCTEEEIEGYVWQTDASGRKEQPLKQADHGCDCKRYLCAAVDGLGIDPSYVHGLMVYEQPYQISAY